MDKIDREFFYAGWRLHFGKLQQPLVDRVNFLLDEFDKSTVFDTKAKIAYALATIKRETAETFAPVKEGYWITKNRVQTLYNYYYKNNRPALRTIFPNGLRTQLLLRVQLFLSVNGIVKVLIVFIKSLAKLLVGRLILRCRLILIIVNTYTLVNLTLSLLVLKWLIGIQTVMLIFSLNVLSLRLWLVYSLE